ncbi:MAG: tyrosine phenol-lyase [Elusimicrobia bacterium]|nr:tyrosine phenol-lyase [Elusimicrobiota bacterium]
MSQPIPEPYRIKMVEPIHLLPREGREEAMRRAGFNTFLLRSQEVYIDLLTDSGTNAMSDSQWAGMLLGDEAYAGSRSFEELRDAVRQVYGYTHVVPAHQGRGAEHLLSRSLIKPGDRVPGNMYFTTTRAHQELAGGVFVDVIGDAAHDPSAELPFKGDIDLAKLARIVESVGAGRVPYVSVGAPVNMAGGQPVSMANLAAVAAYCRPRGIRVVLDAARAIENAYLIQCREPGFKAKPVREILREMCSHTDACTMSAKKDAYANIGGFLAVNDESLYEKARNLCVLFEGLDSYGGMAGRDLEAVARGLREAVERDEWIAHRVGQVRYLWERLDAAGVPLTRPHGGHGVFLDARAFLDHLPREQYPAQALAAALYVESGVRGMERGAVSAGRDHDTGAELFPALELVRLTLPRRVYTQTHLDYVANSVAALHRRRRQVRGLVMSYEPEHLRFFQARFEPAPPQPEASLARSRQSSVV